MNRNPLLNDRRHNPDTRRPPEAPIDDATMLFLALASILCVAAILTVIAEALS